MVTGSVFSSLSWPCSIHYIYASKLSWKKSTERTVQQNSSSVIDRYKPMFTIQIKESEYNSETVEMHKPSISLNSESRQFSCSVHAPISAKRPNGRRLKSRKFITFRISNNPEQLQERMIEA